MTSSAYSRPSKLPGGGGERRLPPRLMRGLTSKIEPKKLGVGLVAGCCLALLTYVSLAKLFAIYSPVFASTANTSSLMQNSPPPSSKPSVPETEAIPPQETLAGGGKNGNAVDRVDLPEAAASEEPGLPQAVTRNEMAAAAGSEEPGLPEAFTRKDDGENAAATSEPKPSAKERKEKQSNGGAAAAGEGKMTCDENGVDEGFPYARPTVCELFGDIRVSPKQKTMYLVNPSGAGGFDESAEKRLRPYARKDDFLLPAVVEVTVKSVPSAAVAPKCTKLHRVPAVVFSVAGYTDNFFHDMTDVMIPVFLTTAHLKGEVQLLITNYKPWWVQKYTPVLRKLSNYDVINFDEDADVHCFPHGFVGLYRDRDLILSPHPTRNPRNYTMVDYNRFVRDALALPRDRPAVLGEEPGMRPRMLIISRAGTRKLLNLDEVAAAASELGFNVTVAEAGADVPAFAALVNSADVLLAVHGAGLTNQIFLPTKAVVVQIVPWGKMDWMATNFYGRPARDMQLRYLEYYVGEEETSLKDKYPREHMIFKDPMAIHARGWQALAEIVMKQDVSVNLNRFRPFLLQALDKLQE
ncbi:beta-1,2-xylosyltransferease XAX1-like [Phragmites australis]|uniref:beta-1,2-xylosyltransferease XAX1-like n=1 Tax=Phragmites australis TaxID=29695 RepID=UPI002D79F651|nr:beta-1,2-xylosyltransferease XAX1-like [Phragmites australis]